jgi:hypothetical protein
MIDDLTMLATLPVDEHAVKKATDEGDKDKAAAADTMPPPKKKADDPADDTTRSRIARRGQDPPEPESGSGSRDPGSND